MSDYPMLISNKLHSFRNFLDANILLFPCILFLLSCFNLQKRLFSIADGTRKGVSEITVQTLRFQSPSIGKSFG